MDFFPGIIIVLMIGVGIAAMAVSTVANSKRTIEIMHVLETRSERA